MPRLPCAGMVRLLKKEKKKAVFFFSALQGTTLRQTTELYEMCVILIKFVKKKKYETEAVQSSDSHQTTNQPLHYKVLAGVNGPLRNKT